MVQTVLIFALGFLAAAFLAAAIAPAIWQRAVELTRRRIEASLPLSLNELQADKDQQRAEFALSVRKLEVAGETVRNKMVGAQTEAARLRDEAQLLVSERDRLRGRIGEQDELIADLESGLSRTSGEAQHLEGRVAELQTALDASLADIDSKQRQVTNLLIDIDSARIEMATRLTEKDKIAGEASAARSARQALEQQLRSSANQLRAAENTHRADAKRIADLERRYEKLVSQSSEKEDRLERREKEVARLRDQIKALNSERNELERRALASERQKKILETQSTTMGQRMEKLAAIASRQDGAAATDAGTRGRDQLLDTVERLTREKAALQEQLRMAAERKTTVADNAALREKLHEVAAMLVAKTAQEEGDASPIHAILSKKEAAPSGLTGMKQDLPRSLADRIRALENEARRA